MAQELSKIPELYFVYITTGSFDIFAGPTFANNKELVDFLTDVLSKVEGIVRVNTRSILEVHKRVFKFLPKIDDKEPQGKSRSRRRPPRARSSAEGYSAVMPEAFTTRLQRSMSFSRKARNSAEVSPTTMPPSLVTRSLISGLASA